MDNKMSGIRERIKKIIGISELSVSAFALKTKNKQKNIANIVNGHNFPSWEVIFNICINAPHIRGLENLDIKWLITGIKNETLDIASDQKQVYNFDDMEAENLKKEIILLNKQLKSKEDIINLQNELLENYRKQLDLM